MTRWLILVCVFVATPSFGGPGGSGGNPSISVGGLEKGYLFRSPYPSKVQVGVFDRYEYGLLGYDVEVGVVPYDPSACLQTSLHKTVCTISDATSVRSLIIFGDAKTYQLTVISRGRTAPRLREVHDELLFSFLRSDQ